MKKFVHHLMGIVSGIILFILTSFVPGVFAEIVSILQKGTAIDLLSSIVILYVGVLGAMMYFFGHMFKAYNKKVSVYFEALFK